MKLHPLVTTVALTACCLVQAEIPGPPAPWERLDFNCRDLDSNRIEGFTFYRYGDEGRHEVSLELLSGDYVWQSTPSDLRASWALGDTGMYVNYVIDRGTGHMKILQSTGERSEHQCELRTTNKF